MGLCHSINRPRLTNQTQLDVKPVSPQQQRQHSLSSVSASDEDLTASSESSESSLSRRYPSLPSSSDVLSAASSASASDLGLSDHRHVLAVPVLEHQCLTGIATVGPSSHFHHNVASCPGAFVSVKETSFMTSTGSVMNVTRTNWLDKGSYGRVSCAILDDRTRVALKTIVLGSQSVADWLRCTSAAASSPALVNTIDALVSAGQSQPQRKAGGSRIKTSSWLSTVAELKTSRAITAAMGPLSMEEAHIAAPQQAWLDVSKFHAETASGHVTARMTMPFLPLSLEYLCDGALSPDCSVWQASPDIHLIAPLVAHDIAKALTTIHAANYVHRDLKADNILADLDGRFFVTDFGLAVPAGPELYMAGGNYVTVAPEVSLSAPSVPHTSADIWAVGVVVAQVLGPLAGHRNPIVGWEHDSTPLNIQQFKWRNFIKQHGGRLPTNESEMRAFPRRSCYCIPTSRWLMALMGQKGGMEAVAFLSAAFTLDAKKRPTASKLLALARAWCDATGALDHRHSVMQRFLETHSRAQALVARKDLVFSVVEAADHLERSGSTSDSRPCIYPYLRPLNVADCLPTRHNTAAGP